MISHATIGIIAGLLLMCTAFPAYVWAIIKGETKPDRVTWWVLSLSSGLLVVSYYMSGARETIWFPIAYCVSFLVVAFLSLKYGAKGDTSLHVMDIGCLVAALITAVVWWFTQSAPIALFLFMGIELFGLIPTMYKSYKSPETEDRTAWIITTAASGLNILAITEWSFIIAAYPVYVLITNSIVLFPLIIHKRS